MSSLPGSVSGKPNQLHYHASDGEDYHRANDTFATAQCEPRAHPAAHSVTHRHDRTHPPEQFQFATEHKQCETV